MFKSKRFLGIGITGLGCALLAGCAGMMAEPTGVVVPGAKWEEVSRTGLIFGEGVVAAADGSIYYSDLTRALPPAKNPGGTIYRFNPATGQTAKYLEPSEMSNGLHVDRNGDLLIAQDAGGEGKGGGRAIARRNLATGAMSVVAGRYQGKRFNGSNDLTSDAQGRIYFSDVLYTGKEPVELPNAVYRVDPDGKVTRLSTDIFRPNGIEVSPDGRRLYVAAFNTKALPTNRNGPAVDKFGIPFGAVVAYDLDSNGNVSNGRVFFRNDELGVDGMTLDRQGNLYVAMHNGNPKNPNTGIVVLRPDGQLLERIPTPGVGWTTNLGFGRGADANSLYVTTAIPIRLFRIQTVRRGHYF